MKHWHRFAQEGLLGTRKTCSDREWLMEQGQACTHAIFVSRGAVEVVRRGPDNRSIVMGIFVAPALLSVEELLTSEPSALHGVRALGEVSYYAIDVSRVWQLMARETLLGEYVRAGAKAACARARFESSRFLDLESVLARLLLAYAGLLGRRTDRGLRIEIRRTQRDLAEATGTVERSVCRVLRNWKEAGYIEKKGGLFTILQPDALETIASSVTGLVPGLQPVAPRLRQKTA